MQKQNRGFTLIELLVVIAVIGLLASIVLVAVNDVRKKARDTLRLTDLRQIQTALELYHDDNGSYPRYDIGSPTCSNGWALNYPTYIDCWNDLASKLSSYLTVLPIDPLDKYPPTPTYAPYHYKARNNGQGYYLLMDPELLDPDDDEGCYGDYWYCIGNNW